MIELEVGGVLVHCSAGISRVCYVVSVVSNPCNCLHHEEKLNILSIGYPLRQE